MDYMKEYKRWLECDKVDSATKDELAAISENKDEIEYRFLRYLEFGTGGLRGTMNAGTNAMNVYTVAHATQGLANLIITEKGEERGVVIARDSRNNSELFSKVAAEVLAANGIKVIFFESLRPTPVLSFSIRLLKCIAGINITASHNPKEYNGYKVYWEDGAQLSLDKAETVSSFIAKTDIFDGVKRKDFNTAVKDGTITIVGPEIDDKYIENVTAQRVDKNIIPEVADNLSIVYTPFHGSGYRLVPEVLRLCGVKHLFPVWQQMVIDGDFPTVSSPNPEYPEGYALAIQLADKVGGDLIIATDPDADRCGVMAKDNDGKFVPLTGNQCGALLLDYILTAYENTNTMPKDPYAVKTIVTTELATKICNAHGVDIYNVLTGFKFIGEVIKNHDDLGVGHYLFGFEESYGYLKGTYSRDKDSVVAAMLITEMTAYYKKMGMTIYQALIAMYEKYGYYAESTVNVTYKGLEGAIKMKELMASIRDNPPVEIAGNRVIEVRDYLHESVENKITGEKSKTGLPVSDVLYFVTEGNNVVVIRPSGTEPKIKLYLLVNGKDKESCNITLARFKTAVEGWTK